MARIFRMTIFKPRNIILDLRITIVSIIVLIIITVIVLVRITALDFTIFIGLSNRLNSIFFTFTSTKVMFLVTLFIY